MKGRLRLIRRVFAIMYTLVLLSTGTFSAFADYEERTESTEEAFETGAVSDGMDQETELSKECGDKFPGEEKIGQTDKSWQDADSEDKSNAGVTESAEKSDLPEKLEKPGKRTDSEDEANEGATERTEESDLPEKLEKPGELADSEDETNGGVTELSEESNPAEKQEESGELADSEDEDDDTVMSSKSRDDITSEEVILQNGGSQSEKYNASEEQKSPEETINPESGKENIETDQGEAENKPAEEDQQFEKTDKQEDAELVDNITDTEEYSSKRSMLLVSKSNDYDIVEDAEENSEESQPREAALRGIKGNAGYTVAVSFPGNPIFQNKSFYILAKIGNEEYKASMTGNIDPVYFGAMDQLPGKPESIAIVDGNNMPLYEINSTAGIYYIISAPILDETNHKYTLSGYKRQNCGICFSSAAGMEMPDTYYIVAKRKGSGRAVAYVQIKNGEAGKVTGRLYNDSTFVIIKTNEFYIDYYNSNPKGYPEYIEKPGSIGESIVVFSWDGEPFNGSYYIYAKPKKDVETEERVDENITVKTKDQNGAELSGLTFGLYQGQECTEETKIAVYSEQSFEISTGFDVLANYLPTMAGLDNATILYLKQIEAPAGYDVDTEIHPVVITRTIRKDLDEESNTYVTTTTYGITIDGKSAIDITNAKRTKEERVDGSVTITIKDQNGAELSGLTFGLYQTQDCVDDSEITTYSGQNFGISTGSVELKSCLPTVMGADDAKILYLKQIEAPAGFDADTKVYSVVITKSVGTELNEGLNTYVTTTTYGITIDGKNAIDITNAKRTKEERVDGSVTITTKDQNGTALSGLTFGLYPAQECTEGTQIATYTGQSIVISTNLDVLAICMPTVTGAENATTLYLKQIEAPAGYDADTEAHPVIITRSVGTELNEGLNTYVTMTTYGMTIDGKNGIDITNAKRTKEERVDGRITITTKDQDGTPLSGLTFGLYLYPAQECTEGTQIATYTGQSIVIDTGLEALTSCLPTMTGAEYATTLYLKQMEAPAGYDVDTEIYPVIITKTVRTDFAEETNTYVTTTTYGITIDGKSAIDITNAKRTKEERVDGSVTITTKDQDGADLSGSSFGLYREQECIEGTELAIYSGQYFEIRTNLDALASYLPTMMDADNTMTLYLKQMEASAGYHVDMEKHPVVITKTIRTDLDEETNTYVTTTTYGITIDGKNEIDITNAKRTKEERTDGSITITTKDQDGADLSGLSFGLYHTQDCTEGTKIAIYSGKSIVIRTNFDALVSYLPTATGADNATTLYLKQMKAPAGYDEDTEIYPVVIMKSVRTELDEGLNTYVTMTTYGITIDDNSTIDIVNTKRTKEERTDGSITIIAKDQNGAELSGLTFGLYQTQDCVDDSEITTYSGQSIVISTNMDVLASYMPTVMGADNATTLYLKQIEAPAGYNADTIVHPVVITKYVGTELNEGLNTYVMTTTYGITIDGESETDITNTKRTKEERIDGSVTITTKDQDGAELSGSTLGLYQGQECIEGTKIATYSERSFEISTGSDALASCLPTITGVDNATVLYLKQIEAPAGYDVDTEMHPVVITKTIRTDLDEESNTYVTTTTYGITIDGESETDITNTKRTKEERTDGSITITTKDQDGAALSGSSFGLYREQECIEGTELAIYSGQNFEIRTNLDALTSYLPTMTGIVNATTLYLKQTTVPAGYDADTTLVHSVVIIKYVGTELNEGLNTYVTTTTYGMTIDGKNGIDITNTKRTKEERADENIMITTKDQDGTPLSGLTVGLYPAQECTEGTKIATYTGQSILIGTGSETLTSCLPTMTGAEYATILYLKQIEAPVGYDEETEIHQVVITKAVRTDLDEESNTYVTTTTYGITIDGKSTIDITNTKRTKEERIDGNVTITIKDQNGAELSGSTFGLYQGQECTEGTELATYGGQNIEIRTNLDALASYLPTMTGADNATTLYLKQMKAPVGYNADTAVHPVIITKSVMTELDKESDMYVTTTTYEITIDGKSAINITNTIRAREERKDGSITITAKDQNGAELSGLSFGLYQTQICTEETEIATYSGQSFEITTGSDALESSLPTTAGADNATILYLKQVTVQADYDIDTELHSVDITKEETTYFEVATNTYITKITYEIRVDGEGEITITNKKHIDGNAEGNTMNPKDEGNITGEENGYIATDGESEGATIDENGNDTTIEGDGNTKTSEGNGDIVTDGEGEGAAIGENGNATIVEGDGNTATAKEDESSTAPKESGNIMTDGEDEGAVASENGNNPDGEVNGNLITFEGNVGISTGEVNEKSATSEGNVDITTGEKDEGTVTGDSPKNATGENKDNFTAIGEAGKNVSGGKTEGNTNIGEDRYSIISDGHEVVSKLEKGEGEANKKPDQIEKGPDKTGINTSTGNASTGLDEKTEQTIQAETADTSFDTDTESQTSKTGQLKKKQNVNKPKVSDGKNKVPAIEQIKGNTEIEMVLQDIISIMNSENPLSFLPDEALAEITSAYSKVLDVQTVELVNYDASMGAVDLVLQTKEKITKETEVRAVFILPGTSVNQHFVVDGIGQEDGTVKVTLDAVMAAELVNKQFISMTLGKQD